MRTVQLLCTACLIIILLSCQQNEVSEKEDIDVVQHTAYSLPNDSIPHSFGHSTNFDVHTIINDLPPFESESVKNFATDFNIFFDYAVASLRAGDTSDLNKIKVKGAVFTDVLEELKVQLNTQDKALLQSFLNDKLRTIQSTPQMEELVEIISLHLSKE